MPERIAPVIKEAIQVITPVNPLIMKAFTTPAEILLIALLVGRKIRLFRNQNNLFPLFLGSILEALAGERPSVQNAARVVFGSASIIKCSEDVLLFLDQVRLMSRIFTGRVYIPIKHKSWEIKTPLRGQSPSIAYFSKINKIRFPILMKKFFCCLGEIFKAIGLFALHFSDACTAYRMNTVSEIFVHGKDMADMLTAEDAPIVNELKRYRKVNDFMLSKLGLSWSTTALVGIITLPAKVRDKTMDYEDVIENFKGNFSLLKEKLEAFGELIETGYLEFITKTKLLKLVPKELVPKNQHRYEQGLEDPNANRFIESPPVRLSVL